MKFRASTSLIAILFAAMLVAPAAASESLAPEYVSSEPSDGEMVDQAPERVEVTFSEPLDQSSDLTVTDECGRTVDDGNVDVQATTMSVGLALKPIGEYKVAYLAKSVAGATGETSGNFDFMVHSGPSCGKKDDGGGHGNHGGNGGGNDSGGHDGHGDGDGNGSGRHDGHSGSRGGTDHSSMGHDRGSMQDHSSMGRGGTSARHGADRHGSGKHGSGRHGSGRHGKHGKAGAHGLLKELKKNENTDRPLAAGPTALPGPNGQAVMTALSLSLLMGLVGGWFLRVSAR